MDPKDLLGVGQSPGIIPGPAPRPAGTPVQIPPAGTPSFRSVLERQQSTTAQPLKFSAHAMQRLASRNIKLSEEDVTRMNVMAEKAADKGAKQSLFMLRDVAMVVSIKNRTVITAVDRESMRENVFTNIDSAAVIQ